MSTDNAGRPVLSSAIPLMCWLAVVAACDRGARSRTGRIHDVPLAPSDGTCLHVEVAIGDEVCLKAPPIVIHPDFAGAKVSSEYDSGALNLQDHQVDRSQLGQSVETFRFRATRLGVTGVTLRITGTAKPTNRIAQYRIEVKR